MRQSFRASGLAVLMILSFDLAQAGPQTKQELGTVCNGLLYRIARQIEYLKSDQSPEAERRLTALKAGLEGVFKQAIAARSEREVMATPVENLLLSPDASGALLFAHINTVGELLKLTMNELRRKMPQVASEIIECVHEWGLHFRGESSVEVVADTPATGSSPVSSTPISELHLTSRIIGILKGAKITTVEELVQNTQQDLVTQKRVGRTALLDIRRALRDRGLYLKNDEPLTAGEPVSDLGLTWATQDILRAGGITTIEQLTSLSLSQLSQIPNVGKRVLKNIERHLELRGLHLKAEAKTAKE